jgi:hypothetical protein
LANVVLELSKRMNGANSKDMILLINFVLYIETFLNEGDSKLGRSQLGFLCLKGLFIKLLNRCHSIK